MESRHSWNGIFPDVAAMELEECRKASLPAADKARIKAAKDKRERKAAKRAAAQKGGA